MTLRWKITLIAIVVLLLAAITSWRLFAPITRLATGSSIRLEQNSDFIPLDTPTDLPPTPTETLLPYIPLPTPESYIPVIESWAGMPTYAESQPGYFFRVDYDGSLWSLTWDETGTLALIHRTIPYCKILPTAGRGLPRGWTVDDQFRDIGTLRYEVVTASQNGMVQFVNYFSGDGVVLTGFQVSFQEQMNDCLLASEIILGSLTSVVAPSPTVTPTETPTETSTPTATTLP
jgi:hypothetical protein